MTVHTSNCRVSVKWCVTFVFCLVFFSGYSFPSGAPPSTEAKRKNPVTTSSKQADPATVSPKSQNVKQTSSKPQISTKNKEAIERELEAQREFCGIVNQCGLEKNKQDCPDSLAKGLKEVVYDRDRCKEAKVLYSRGVTSGNLTGFRVYRFLGQQYRINYPVADTLPISNERLTYLLNDLPLAAKLLSHLQKVEYKAAYLDGNIKKQFKGSKGKNLHGQATSISGSTEERHLYYFGFGIAEVLWWRLKGYALMDFTYVPVSSSKGKTSYRMDILVFPGNSVVNVIMNMNMFKKIVYGKIKEVLEDISNASRKLAAEGLKDPKDFSAQEKAKVKEFLKLP